MSNILVAKSYIGLPVLSEVFTVNKKNYVTVQLKSGATKDVRVYSEAEYKKFYPDWNSDEEKKKDPYWKSQKDILGFVDGYITIFKNSKYEQKEWFKEIGATYRKWWGWSLPSDIEVPSELPEGVIPVRLEWSAVGANDEVLKPEDQVKAVCDQLLNDPDPSVFQGNVGESLTVVVTIEKAIDLDGYYGRSRMHIMRDQDGNCYVWTTASKSWEAGSTRTIRGQVKEHKIYKNTAQTILIRCKEIIK